MSNEISSFWSGSSGDPGIPGSAASGGLGTATRPLARREGRSQGRQAGELGGASSQGGRDTPRLGRPGPRMEIQDQTQDPKKSSSMAAYGRVLSAATFVVLCRPARWFLDGESTSGVLYLSAIRDCSLPSSLNPGLGVVGLQTARGKRGRGPECVRIIHDLTRFSTADDPQVAEEGTDVAKYLLADTATLTDSCCSQTAMSRVTQSHIGSDIWTWWLHSARCMGRCSGAPREHA